MLFFENYFQGAAYKQASGITKKQKKFGLATKELDEQNGQCELIVARVIGKHLEKLNDLGRLENSINIVSVTWKDGALANIDHVISYPPKLYSAIKFQDRQKTTQLWKQATLINFVNEFVNISNYSHTTAADKQTNRQTANFAKWSMRALLMTKHNN